MIHTYTLTGMTCEACDYKVKHLLSQVPGITSVNVSRDKNEAVITMEKHISIDELQQALGGLASKYQIREQTAFVQEEKTRSWFETYKPILLIFSFITGASLLVQFAHPPFDFMQWMSHFMAGFFLVFSFFKLLNLSAFAESYAMYDVVAKKMKAWGYMYAFIELGLGISYLVNFQPFVTNAITFMVMSVSIVGVLSSVLNKQKIQCACLGAVFNLPMSTVTIIEDGLMIGMSLVMMIMLF